MSSPSSGAVRALRASGLGAVCVSLALAGHVVAGGRAPSLWALVVLAVPMAAVSAWLTGRRCGLPTMAATVAGSQLLLHEAFMWAAAGSSCAVAGDPHAHLGHGPVGPVLDCTAMPGMAASTGTGHFAAGAMLFAHLVAGVVTTLVLAYGEALLWRVGQRVLRLPVTSSRPVLVAGPAAIASGRTVVRARILAGPLRRRGPPVAQPADA